MLKLQDLGLTKRNRVGHIVRLKRRYRRMVEKQDWFKLREREEAEGKKHSVEGERISNRTMSRETRNFDNVMFIQHTKE